MVESENQALEWKCRVDNFREVSKAGCAFANAFGGRVIIGVASDGAVVGVPERELDVLQQRLEGALQQISPVPLHKISVEEHDGRKTVAVDVYPLGPGAFCTFGGIVYYRAGSTDAKLEGRTLQDFLVNRQILVFDQAVSPTQLSDIDPKKVRAFLERRSPAIAFHEKNLADCLLNLGVAKKNGTLAIKNAAVLFFARDLPRFLPQAELRLARFRGTQPVEVIDSRFVAVTLIEALADAEAFVKKNTRTGMRFGQLQRVDLPEYPPTVVREALVNALSHRDYYSHDAIQLSIFDDRLELTNPGRLPAGLSLQLLGTLSIQRNPIAYRLLRDLNLVEGLATGIPRMRDDMRTAGLPEPEFIELGNFFRVTLRNQIRTAPSELNARQQRALDWLEKNPAITAKNYAKLAGVTRPTAVADLNDLADKKIVKKTGKARATYYAKTKT